MTVRVEAWRRHLPSLDARKVTEAIFTYVAIGLYLCCNRRKPAATPPAAGSPILGGRLHSRPQDCPWKYL
jgi:hypothetical protein